MRVTSINGIKRTDNSKLKMTSKYSIKKDEAANKIKIMNTE